jgi:GT2 family glycosyltransferase
MNQGNQMPLASIIVPTWNGIEYIEDCLDSLLAQDYPEFEVIIVDNASSDGTPEWVAEHFPMITLVRNEQNLGFAGGVNVGLQIARGDVLILFNQDAAAEPGWLCALISGLLAAPDIGVVGCKIYHWDGKTIWHAGVEYHPDRGATLLRGYGEPDRKQYDQPADMSSVVGVAMAFKREVLAQIGGLDEDFFFYLEDTDFCWRARQVGFRVAYIPEATVRHHGTASLGHASNRAFRAYHHSRLLFLLKHFEADWFGNPFLSAETAWLKEGRSFHEYRAIREVYLDTMSGLIQDLPPYQLTRRRFNHEQRKMIVAVLSRLAETIVEAMQIDPEKRQWHLGQETGDWWQVTERPFTSPVPLLGPFIALFRDMWNNVAARWYVRGLLVQQLEINRRLVFTVEMNNRLIQDLNRDVILLRRELARLLAEQDVQDREIQ